MTETKLKNLNRKSS